MDESQRVAQERQARRAAIQDAGEESNDSEPSVVARTYFGVAVFGCM